MKDDELIELIECDSRRSRYTAGRFGVKRIGYHPAMGEGDRHYCTVHFEDGAESQIFDIDEIYWRPEK